MTIESCNILWSLLNALRHWIVSAQAADVCFVHSPHIQVLIVWVTILDTSFFLKTSFRHKLLQNEPLKFPFSGRNAVAVCCAQCQALMDLGGLSIDASMALAWRVNRNGNALNLDESSNQKSPAFSI